MKKWGKILVLWTFLTLFCNWNLWHIIILKLNVSKLECYLIKGNKIYVCICIYIDIHGNTVFEIAANIFNYEKVAILSCFYIWNYPGQCLKCSLLIFIDKQWWWINFTFWHFFFFFRYLAWWCRWYRHKCLLPLS